MSSDPFKNLLPKNGELYLYTSVFSADECDKLLNSLYESINWKQEKIRIFGKWVKQPRLSAWYGDDGKQYSYSGITLEAKQWIEPLLKIKNKIQSITNSEFNSGLLNYYRDGEDSMGWHRDNEKELGLQPVIGSISLGATRTFNMQHIKEKELKLSLELPTGSCLLMRGSTQHFWKHSVPKDSNCISPRLNITFRYVH